MLDVVISSPDRSRRRTSVAAGFLAFAISAGVALVVAGEEPIDFNRDIRPILSDQCFHCHGPDAKNQKSDFRLDTRDNLFADLGGYFGVKAGSLEDSELHWRIRSDDAADVMPPPDSNRSLSDAQKDLLDRWIREGAPYAGHWSFDPPIRPEAPSVKNADWNRNPIDRFILSRLNQENLAPTAKADRTTLLRRAALALTGLPPTPDQVDAFLADESTDAWPKQIDRLLDSIDYAERQTLLWLDAARYADTDGYQNDAERSNWPWRDWVIRSFHENQPFDQFTIEQLAGDMLPDATPDQVLASAFNRNHRQNSEGGALAEEFFVENVIDRVETTSTVWLGLTTGCARCHDHKYDPITQREFFQLYAYFNNIGERGTGKGVTANPILTIGSPLRIPPPELTERRDTARKAVTVAESSLKDRFEAWAVAALKPRRDGDWRSADVVAATTTKGNLKAEADGSWILEGNVKENATYTVTIDAGSDRITGLRLDALTHPSFAKPRQLARSVNGNFVLGEVSVKANGKPVPIREAIATFAQDNYPVKNLIDGKPGTGWAIHSDKPENVSAFLLFETPLESDDEPHKLVVTLTHASPFKDHNVGRFQLQLTGQDHPDLEGASPFPAEVLAALKTPAEQRNKNQQKTLLDHYREVDVPLRSARQELQKIERQLTSAGFGEVPVMVMQERDGEPRPAYFLHRGQYTEPDLSEALPRAIPASLHSETLDNQPKDRLELARWIVSPENPLTARVVVNRVWQSLFGTGIVKTTEDFGLQGEMPIHPELLDWLAVEFRESGWNLKALFRLILTSETFQQGSMIDPTLLSRDPENRLLARGPRYRLDGFSIRDSALQAANLLHREPGGPPVKPYQPPGLWNAVNQNQNFRYNPSQGDDLYRKSLYTYWKRAVNPPRQIIFDAAGRETCNVRRRATNTPLQALALMNDETFLEAARHLAERTAKTEPSNSNAIVSELYAHATAREATPETVAILSDSLAYYREHFSGNEEGAQAFLSIGASPRDESLDVAEHAARTAVAHLVLNLDETITLE